jgi:hypothetical protein
MNDYWICNDAIIFTPNFNSKLINYTDILNKYNKLIFSNYDDPLICIETNNKYKEIYHTNYEENIFNQLINIPTSI